MSNGDEERNEMRFVNWSRFMYRRQRSHNSTLDPSNHPLYGDRYPCCARAGAQRGGNLFDSHGDSVTNQSQHRRFREIQIAISPFGGNWTVGRYVVYVPTMEKIRGSGAKIATRSEQEKSFRSSPSLSPLPLSRM